MQQLRCEGDDFIKERENVSQHGIYLSIKQGFKVAALLLCRCSCS
jgi:hypothetical protein